MVEPQVTRDKEEKHLTESEYLQREVERAKVAISRAWDDAKTKALQGVDPRVWTREHPWYALSGATVAGFLAALALTPSKREQALKKIAELNRALAGIDPGEEAPVEPAVADEKARAYRDGFVAGDTDAPGRKSGILGAIGSQIIKSVGPAIISAITAAISAKSAEDVARATNGKPPQDPDDSTDAGGDWANPT